MADVIHKYGPFSSYNSSFLSVQGKPVHVDIQDNNVFVWCRKAVNADNSWTTVQMVATGQEYLGNYIGTVVLPNNLVYHAIEVI